MNRLIPRVLSLLLAAAFPSSCKPPLQDVTYCAAPSAAELSTENTPTWEADIRPLVEKHCSTCHQEDGPTPFVLREYEDFRQNKELIQGVVSSGRMPPWGAAPCCQHYKASRQMPDEARALLLAWLDGGAPAGSNTPTRATPASRPGLSRVDLTLEMPSAFTPAPVDGTEEQRCFMTDWPEHEDRFLTGTDIEPGARSTVHHVIIYHPTDAQEIAQYEELDGKDGRPGWPCEGGKLGASTALPTPLIAGYSPGTYPMDYPDGLGVRIPRDGKIIFQMHYTIDHGVFEDRTRVHFKLDDKVRAEVWLITVMDWNWPYVAGDFVVPKGDDDVRYQVTQPLVVPSGTWNRVWPLRLYTANLHMHEFGKRARINVKHQDGSSDCLLEMERWSMEFVGDYWLEKPLFVQAGDKFFLECVFDNSEANQPVENGKRREPRDLTWDEDGEMCAAFVTIAGEPIY